MGMPSPSDAGLGDGDIGGEGAGAEGAQIDVHGRDARGRAKNFATRDGGVELDAMALAVVERESVAVVTVAAGDGEASGGIQAAAQQTHCFLHGKPHFNGLRALLI